MTEPRPYPQGTDDDGQGPEEHEQSWGARIAIVAVGAVLVVIIALHLTGTMGPGAH